MTQSLPHQYSQSQREAPDCNPQTKPTWRGGHSTHMEVRGWSFLLSFLIPFLHRGVPESCKVTVTCSTQSSSLNSTFTCTPRTCSEDGGDPAEVVTSDARLNLYLSNGLIAICNHSNEVSWSNDTMEIKPLCSGFRDNNPNYATLIILCRLVFVIPIIILVIFYCWRKKKNHLKVHFDQSSNCDQAAAVYMNVSLSGAPPLPLEPADMELNPIRA
ncbi:unnamed protein product [Boreogadus saida]